MLDVESRIPPCSVGNRPPWFSSNQEEAKTGCLPRAWDLRQGPIPAELMVFLQRLCALQAY